MPDINKESELQVMFQTFIINEGVFVLGNMLHIYFK